MNDNQIHKYWPALENDNQIPKHWPPLENDNQIPKYWPALATDNQIPKYWPPLVNDNQTPMYSTSGEARAKCMLVLIPSEQQRGHPEGHPEGSRPVCQRVCLTTPAPACEGWERISLLSGSAHTHTHTHTRFGFSVRRFDGWSRSTCSPICQCTSLQYYWEHLMCLVVLCTSCLCTNLYKSIHAAPCRVRGLAQKASSGVPNWRWGVNLEHRHLRNIYPHHVLKRKETKDEHKIYSVFSSEHRHTSPLIATISKLLIT